MFYPLIQPDPPYTYSWPQLPVFSSGGHHEERIPTERPAIRRTRLSAQYHVLGRCFSQLFDHFVVQRRPYDFGYWRNPRLQSGNGQTRPATLSTRRHPGLDAEKIAGASQPGHPVVSRHTGQDGANQSPRVGVWLCDLVGGTLGAASGPRDWYWLQRRSDTPSVASRGLLGASSQAHHERQTRRSRLSKGQGPVAAAQKKSPGQGCA